MTPTSARTESKSFRFQDQAKDTRILVQSGVALMAIALLSTALTSLLFGGFSPLGPHSSTGWTLLVLALVTFPLGLLAFALGGAKWLGRR